MDLKTLLSEGKKLQSPINTKFWLDKLLEMEIAAKFRMVSLR